MSQDESQLSDDIDGFKYRVYYLDPLVAADILADIGYLMAPVLGSVGGVAAKERGDLIGGIMDGFEGEDGDATSSSIDSAIEKAVLGFFDRMSKAKQRELMGLLMPVTMVVMPDGVSEPKLSTVFNMHFRGRMKPMYQWFAFAMKTQFKDFFSGLEDVMSRALAKPETPQAPSL